MCPDRITSGSQKVELEQCELLPLKGWSFLFQRIPIEFSTGLKSRSSCGTMSRSLLNRLYVNRDRTIHELARPSEPDRSTNIYMDLRAYILCLPLKIRSTTLFFGGKFVFISRGTIHLNPEGVEFSLPLDPQRYSE